METNNLEVLVKAEPKLADWLKQVMDKGRMHGLSISVSGDKELLLMKNGQSEKVDLT